MQSYNSDFLSKLNLLIKYFFKRMLYGTYNNLFVPTFAVTRGLPQEELFPSL